MPNELRGEVLSALRGALRRPVFSLAVVTTLAVAIGANAAIFALVDGVLLRRLPFTDPERLVIVHVREADTDQPLSIANFFDLRDGSRSFDALVAWGSGAANLTGVEEPVRLAAQWVSSGFFAAMGVRPTLGRAPLPEEERPGAPRVVLLGDAVWRSLFGADPGVLGRVVTLEGEPFTVIGVLAPDFVFMSPQAQVVAPFHLETDPRRANRGASFLRLIGRLAPGVTPEMAAAELDGLVAGLRAAYPDSNGSQQGVRLEALAERVVGGVRTTLLALQVAVGVLLLLACVNLANLLLARVAGRRAELALRLALGARRRDLVRQLAVEAVTLAFLGGALGLGVAAVALRLLLAFGSDRLPRVGEVGIDGRVALFALAVSLVVGLGLAVLPALHGSGAALRHGLGEGRPGGTTARRGPARAALLVVEATLALVLLAVGGLMLRSYHRLQSVDPGYRPDRVLALQLSLPKTVYATPEALARYGEELVARLGALPGVDAAAVTSVSPLAPWRASVHFTIEGREEGRREDAPIANYRAVGPGYFSTIGIPLRAGRDVTERDRAAAVPVALVSETLAERHFPDRSPLGARLTIDDVGGAWRTVEVVGVVGDVKHTGLDAEDSADVYVPYAQTPSEVSIWLANLFCVVVRATGSPDALGPAVRRQVRELDPDVTVGLGSMEGALAESLARRRLDTALLVIFGIAALALALAGIYAVAAIGVAERRPEIAVRISLGAGRHRILGLVMGGTFVPVAIGLVIGLVATLALGRLLATLLFGVAPHDTATLAVACAALAAAALLASLVPALRALRVDPATILRSS